MSAAPLPIQWCRAFAAASVCASAAHAQSFQFASPVTRACTPQHYPTRIVPTDVDLNGTLDLLVPGRDGDGLVNWASLDSLGVPGAMQMFASPGQTDAAVAGDFNGDGTSDLAFAVRAFAGKIAVYLRGEEGIPQDPVLTALDREPRALVAGDWDGNGVMDLASTQYGNNVALILHNDGGGAFSVWQRLPLEPWSGSGAGPQELLAGDMNGDGRDDLVVSMLSTRRVDVLLSNGNGTFAPPAAWMAPDLPNGSRPGVTTAALGDLDGDGDRDIAVSLLAPSGPQYLMVLVNQGNAHFDAPLLFEGPLSGLSWAAALGDLDADGDLDAVTGTALPGGLFVWENTTLPEGAVTFSEPQQIGSGTFVRDIAIAHVDNDCDLDVVFAEIGVHTIKVYRQLRDCGAGAAAEANKSKAALAGRAFHEDRREFAASQAAGDELRAHATDGAELAVLLSTFGGPPDRAALAQAMGTESCGPAGPGGRCDEPHITPGCFTTPCCEAVCKVAPYCCETVWDEVCVEIADSECDGMVCPQYGLCTEVHDDPGCEDPDCCTRITRIDGYCRELWDHICVERVAELCGTVPCTVTVPEGAIDENEPCYLHQNDGPNYLEDLVWDVPCGQAFTGTIHTGSPRDSEWIPVPGSGRRHIQLELASEFPAQVHLVSGPFAGPLQAVQTVYGGQCTPVVLDAIVDGPNPWHVVITMGTPAGPIRQGQPCTEEDPKDPWTRENPQPTPGFDGSRYVATLECLPAFNPADFNHDGIVDGADLGLLLGQWGVTGFPFADLTGDGTVDGADLGTLLGEWGPVE